MDDNTLDTLAGRHIPAGALAGERAICSYCEDHWPCAVAQLAGEIMRLRAVHARLQARLDDCIADLRAWTLLG